MAENDTMLSRHPAIDRRGSLERSLKTELRCEMPSHELTVLDGVCNGEDRSRTDVVREILAEWSAKKLHAATVICRVAGVNPMVSDRARSE